jgi:hypothetical protein
MHTRERITFHTERAEEAFLHINAGKDSFLFLKVSFSEQRQHQKCIAAFITHFLLGQSPIFKET